MDVRRCSRGYTSAWQKIHILRLGLYPNNNHQKHLSSRNTSCITLLKFPKSPEGVIFFSDESAVGSNCLNQLCRKTVVRKCGKNIQKNKYSMEC